MVLGAHLMYRLVVGFWWILEKASLNVQSLPWAPTVTEKCVLAVGLTYQDNGGGKMLLGPLGGSHVRKHRFHLFLRPPTQELGNSRRRSTNRRISNLNPSQQRGFRPLQKML